MSKHTEGPWKVKENPKQNQRIISIWGHRYGCSRKVCEVIRNGWGNEQVRDEMRADARLIAAAPDLLAAAQVAADWINSQILTANDVTDYDRKVYRTIQEAIAKAEGK